VRLDCLQHRVPDFVFYVESSIQIDVFTVCIFAPFFQRSRDLKQTAAAGATAKLEAFPRQTTTNDLKHVSSFRIYIIHLIYLINITPFKF
jgi:hypothetical protein